jgi:pilus assembly protein CpaE
MMDQSTISAAIISTDAELRESVRGIAEADGRVTVATQIGLPFAEISREELTKLRKLDPQLVFLDLEDDPETGIRLANFLSEGSPNRRFIGIGPALETQMLMEAMRAGLSEYVLKPVDPEEISKAVRRIERKVLGATESGAQRAGPGEVFAVFSPKGGSGSTTVATNLAIHLQQITGKKTLLVDLDLELGEIAVLLGMQPRFNFVDMIRNFHRMDTELLASYIEKHHSGVHLLSAPFHPEKAEVVAGEGIQRILQFLKQHYDYVVVDTSKSFSPATLATFEQADRIFLLTNVDLPSLRNIKRCQPLLDRIVGADIERVRLVVNRYHNNEVISLEEVERTLGMRVYATLSNDYESVIRSINSGNPVIDNEKSPFARDLRALGALIAGLNPATNGHRNRIPMLSKLFARKQA